MLAYWRERLPLHRFVPFACVVGVAAQAGRDAFELTAWLTDVIMALSLIAQFRLWDDLADRNRDACIHPERVLVRVASVLRFQSACVAIAVFNALAVVARASTILPIAVFLALNTIMSLWYSLRGTSPAAVGELIRQSKYPAFVLILAASSATVHAATLSISMAVLYGAACLYEAWHDTASPLRMWRQREVNL